MTEDVGSHEQMTIGGPADLRDVSNGPLYVGPPDDPDRYELLDGGTRGGEGRTWRASYRGGLNSPLVEAVKMLFPPEGPIANWPTEADLRRWHDNAALLRHLAQPHVVQLHDIFGGDVPHTKESAGGERSVAYLTMEWVEGPTLAAHVRGKPVTGASLTERLPYIEDVATAVASLHSHTRSAGNPVLHRDLTPANCIVHATRGIVLIDISGMRLIDDGFDPLGRHTPAYTAPEVLRAPQEPRHPSSDLYAVGAVAAFVLLGQDPDVDPAHRPALLKRLAALLEEADAGSAGAAAEHLLGLLHPDPAERPSDVLAWSRVLTALAAPAEAIAEREPTATTIRPGDVADQPIDSPGTSVGRSPRARPGSRRRRIVAMGTAAIVLTTGVGAVLLARQDRTAGGAASAAVSRPTTTLTPQVTRLPQVQGLAQPLNASEGLSKVDFSSAFGRFTTPARGARVQNCAYFTGTSKLPPGQTIMLSMHDLGIDDDIRWMQVVFGYEHPGTLATWSGAQYFNDQAIGHDVHIELIEMPLDPALRRANANNDMPALSRLADQGKVIAATTVTRVKGINPKSPCPPPAGVT